MLRGLIIRVEENGAFTVPAGQRFFVLLFPKERPDLIGFMLGFNGKKRLYSFTFALPPHFRCWLAVGDSK